MMMMRGLFPRRERCHRGCSCSSCVDVSATLLPQCATTCTLRTASATAPLARRSARCSQVRVKYKWIQLIKSIELPFISVRQQRAHLFDEHWRRRCASRAQYRAIGLHDFRMQGLFHLPMSNRRKRLSRRSDPHDLRQGYNHSTPSR